jgi:SAM-dependent methyltransferase
MYRANALRPEGILLPPPSHHESIEQDRQQFIAQLPAGSKILDCGWGPVMDTERFSHLGYNVTAIDLSDRFVKLAKKRVPTASVKKMDMRYLAFPKGAFDGIGASFSLLHIRTSETERTLSSFKSVLRDRGLFFAALHRGPKTKWVKTTISGMDRDTYLQEWLQTDIEAVVRGAGFEIIGSRPFERRGGRYPLLSILAHAREPGMTDYSASALPDGLSTNILTRLWTGRTVNRSKPAALLGLFPEDNRNQVLDFVESGFGWLWRRAATSQAFDAQVGTPSRGSTHRTRTM